MQNSLSPNFPLIFAPMEGITDHHFRRLILENYPEWDYVFTDFLRLSTNQNFRDSHILNFYGVDLYDTANIYCQKVVLQILSTEKSTTEHNIKQIAQLGFPWLDLNLGCPSKQVNSHGGGSYLMSDLRALEKILHTIRKNFSGKLSVKIRLGYKDHTNFFKALKLFEALEVNLITIHGRTQQELYKGKANWDLIAQAQQHTSIPIWGNGDIRYAEDIKSISDRNIVNGVMIGRGALRRPWMAKQHQQNFDYSIELEEHLRGEFIYKILSQYSHLEEYALLKKMKKLTHYLFDEEEQELKSFLLRSSSLREMMQKLPVIKP